MIFSDVRIKDIKSVVHYVPQITKFSSKKRNFHIIGIQLSGNAEHIFDDRQFTLDENSIYFFNQNEDYHVKIKEKGLSFSVHFTTYSPINLKSFRIKIKESSAVIRILNNIEQELLRVGECNAKVLSELYKLLVNYEEIYSKKYTPKNINILKAKDYINLHFKEKDCIAKAAKEYGVTVRRFGDIFKNEFNTPPNQYIIHRKINLAKEYLQSNDLSIEDISNLCGFSDIYYFSKTFKKVTGQTATEYRKSCKY